MLNMAVRSVASFPFKYEPPFPWRGPRPIVEATRFDRMTTVTIGRRTIAVDAGNWLVQSDDGELTTLSDSVFRRWYQPVSSEGKRALNPNDPFPKGPRRKRRKRPKHDRPSSAQRTLKL